MSMLLREVIDIPERTGVEDYVLRLTDGIEDSRVEQTLRDYVVTPALVDAFDRALDLVTGALRDRQSRGTFLSGSFGSGKSHFMAVLHALLRHQPRARAIGALQGVVATHDPDLQGKKILPLAYHLLGAASLEEALLGGYIRQIRQLHPGVPLPAVHEDQAILADGERTRGALGDERFFAALNEGAEQDVWAAVLGSGSWDRQRYDEARAAQPGDEACQQLVTVLVEKFFSAYTDQAGYLDLSTAVWPRSRRTRRGWATTRSCSSSTSWCCGWRSPCRTGSSSGGSRRHLTVLSVKQRRAISARAGHEWPPLRRLGPTLLWVVLADLEDGESCLLRTRREPQAGT